MEVRRRSRENPTDRDGGTEGRAPRTVICSCPRLLGFPQATLSHSVAYGKGEPARQPEMLGSVKMVRFSLDGIKNVRKYLQREKRRDHPAARPPTPSSSFCQAPGL